MWPRTRPTACVPFSVLSVIFQPPTIWPSRLPWDCACAGAAPCAKYVPNSAVSPSDADVKWSTQAWSVWFWTPRDAISAFV